MPLPGVALSPSVATQVSARTIAVVVYLVVFFGPPALCLSAGLPRIWTWVRASIVALDLVADASEGDRVAFEGRTRSAGYVPESAPDDRLLDADDGDGFEGVPFLLECPDGTVLVRGDRLDGLGKSGPYASSSLDADETAYVSGIARSPDAATAVPVPDEVDLVVGPPERSDPLGFLRSLVSSFVVANGSRAEYASYRLRQGLLASALAPVWMIALFVVLTGNAEPTVCRRYFVC